MPPTPPTERRFELNGVHYEYTLHPPREGWRLATRLSSRLIKPILSGLGPAVVAAVEGAPKGGGSPQGLIKALLDDSAALEGLDFGRIAEGLEAAVQAVDDATLYDVLRYTNRDGKALVTDSGKPTSEFDRAFAGNYVELGRAFWSVASGNGFLPGLDSLSAVRKSIGSLAATAPGTRE